MGYVFFEFDSAKLDGDDEIKLGKLRGPYSTLLLGKEVQFSCVGYADHRGSRDYNLRLGMRRAMVVKKSLDRMFRQRFANYSAATGASFGESASAQPSRGRKPSRHRMALDRLVLISVNRIPNKKKEIPPVRIEGIDPNVTMHRITGREFEDIPKEESHLVPPSATEQAVDHWKEEAPKEIIRVLRG